MTIRFYEAEDIKRKVSEIVKILGFSHVDLARLVCVRSTGSNARRTLARCYALPRIWQTALKTRAHYVIEIISEAYEKLSEDEREKVLVHELMHIPASFGGGFRHHGDHVTERNVEQMYRKYKSLLSSAAKGP
jgi:predicted metallopeptidase